MATDKRQYTKRMQPENYDKIRVIAAKNKRSVAMQIEYLLEQCIAEYESSYGKITFTTPKNVNIDVRNNSGNNYGIVGGNFNSSMTIG